MENSESKSAADEEACLEFIRGDIFVSSISENFIKETLIKSTTRTVVAKVFNIWETGWGIMLRSPSVNDIHSVEGERFKRGFRVDPSMFCDIILPLCKEGNVFEMKYESFIPIELKILIALRILGGDHDGDTVSELSTVGESTCNQIFKLLNKKNSLHYFSTNVSSPSEEELECVMKVHFFEIALNLCLTCI